MGLSKMHEATSNYPFPLTYIVIGISVLFSAICTALLSYFVYYLRMDSMSVPWEFIILISTSSLTLAVHMLSVYLHHTRRSLHPLHSVIFHAVLLALWVAGLSLLAEKIAPMVLSSSCGISVWLTPMGIMVCRLYKALFAFVVLGTSAILAAAGLDVKVWLEGRQLINGGAYWEVGINSKKKRAFGLGIGGRARTWREGDGVGYERSSNPIAATVPVSANQDRGMGLSRGIASWKQEKQQQEQEHSPDMGDAGDMGDAQRLVKQSPDMGYTPYGTPMLS